MQPATRNTLCILLGASTLTSLGCGSEPQANNAEQEHSSGVVLVDEDTLPREIIEGDIRIELPQEWTRVVPTSTMRAHQFIAGVTPDGVAANGAVFTSIGGSIESNLQRWASQLSGDSATTQTSQAILNDRTAATFVGTGTFDAGRAMGSTGPREGWVVLGILVQTNTSKPFVLKVDGPASVLDPDSDAWASLVRSVQLGGESVFTDENGVTQ